MQPSTNVSTFGRDERLEVFLGDQASRVVIGPAFFDERHEQRTGARRDRHVRIERANRSLIRSRLDRPHRADHADVSAACGRDRRARSRLDDANHGHVHLLAQCAESVGGGGVAGDDDALHSLIAKKAGDLATVSSNGFRALRTIRHARGIAKVDDALVRQLVNQFLARQSARQCPSRRRRSAAALELTM